MSSADKHDRGNPARGPEGFGFDVNAAFKRTQLERTRLVDAVYELGL
jgi:hypothetical protein